MWVVGSVDAEGFGVTRILEADNSQAARPRGLWGSPKLRLPGN